MKIIVSTQQNQWQYEIDMLAVYMHQHSWQTIHAPCARPRQVKHMYANNLHSMYTRQVLLGMHTRPVVVTQNREKQYFSIPI